MEMLYKYYSNQSIHAFENIKNGVISFTPLVTLNDPLEGLGTYNYNTTEDAQRFWNCISSNAPKLLEENLSRGTRDMLNFKHRIFSTSKECTNSLLWAHYANSHKGFCIGYEKTSIQNVTDNIHDVSYCVKRPYIDVNKPDELINLLYVKSKVWSYEKECRAVYSLKDSDVSHFNKELYFDSNKDCNYIYKLHGHTQQKNLETLRSPKFITKECPPNEIYFGMNMTDKDKKRLFNISHKYNVKFYQVKYADITFEFIAEEIPKEYLEFILSDSQTASS